MKPRFLLAIGCVVISVTLTRGAGVGWPMGWGANDAGQCEPPADLGDVVAIAAGARHVLAVRNDGRLAAWGDDTFGQTDVPPGLKRVVQAAAGDRHSLVLFEDGTVAGWGDGLDGQLSVPPGLFGVVQVAAGGAHSVALRGDGTVVAWGANAFGQGSVPVVLSQVRSIAAGGFHNVALRTDGTVVTWGHGSGLENRVPPGLSNVVRIAAGRHHSVALLDNGSIVTWGFPSGATTNPPPAYTNVVAVAANAANTLALQSDGMVVAWSEAGITGDDYPTGLPPALFVAAGGLHQWVVTAGPVIRRQPADAPLQVGGEVVFRTEVDGPWPRILQWWHDGVSIPGATNAELQLNGMGIELEGRYQLEMVTTGGRVVSREARLWLPPMILKQPESVAVFQGDDAVLNVEVAGSEPLAFQWRFKPLWGSTTQTVARATGAVLVLADVAYAQSGSYWLQASNAYGTVTSSVAQVSAESSTVTPLTTGRADLRYGDATTLSAGWGRGTPFYWQRDGETIPTSLNGNLVLTNARPADAGRYRIAELRAAGWAYSPELQLNVDRAHLIQYEGRRLVLEAGTAWGLARHYQWTHDGAPRPDATAQILVLDPLRIEDAGDYTALVEFGAGAREVAVARVTVLPRPAVGRVVYWGAEGHQPLSPLAGVQNLIGLGGNAGSLAGLTADGRVLFTSGEAPWYFHGDRLIRPVVRLHEGWNGPVVLSDDGRAWTSTGTWCWPCPALEENRYVQVAYGEEHAVGLRDDGAVRAWGHNGFGQCTIPDALDAVLAVTAGGFFSAALKTDGSVVVWGALPGGDPAGPAGWRSIRAIAAGSQHLLALHTNGTVFAWGDNLSGQCDVPSGLSDVQRLAAGRRHSLALRTDGSVAAWGANEAGQCLPPPGLSNVVALVGLESGSAALIGSTRRPAIDEQPGDLTASLGSAVALRVHATSGLALRYQWEREGIAIVGATNATLELAPVRAEDAGVYRVWVSTDEGALVSDVVTVWVTQVPILSLPARRGVVECWGSYNRQDLLPPPWGQMVAVQVDQSSGNVFGFRPDGTIAQWGPGGAPEVSGTNYVQVLRAADAWWGLRTDGWVDRWDPAPPAIVVPFTGLRDVRALSPMANTLLALHLDGTLTCPDVPGLIPADLANVVAMASRDFDAVALLADGTLRVLGDGPAPPAVEGWASVCAGFQHYLGLRRDGTVAAWGDNSGGACDVPPGLENVVAIAAGWSTSYAVTRSGRLVGWGADAGGSLQFSEGMTNVFAVSAGYSQVAVLRGGPAILRRPADLAAAPGQLARFEIQAESDEPLSYQWRFRDLDLAGATAPVLEVGPVGPEHAGFYSVRVADSQGSTMAQAELALAEPPRVLVEPQDVVVAQGQTAMLEALGQGSGLLTYRWQRADGSGVGGNAMTLVLSPVTAPEAWYRVVITNDHGSVTSRLARVVGVAPPVLLSQPQGAHVVEGESFELSVTLGGTPPFAMQWRRGDADLTQATNAILRVGPVTPSDAGNYVVVVTNLAGRVESQPALIRVVGPEPVIVHGPASQSVPPDATVVLDVEATGANPLHYQWRFNGVPLESVAGPVLRLERVDALQLGVYQVRVTNALGSAESAPAELRFAVVPNVVAWGANDFGNLDVPPTLTNALRVSASRHSLALCEDGTVVSWGANDTGQATVPVLPSSAIEVGAGAEHSVVLLDDGSVVAWGTNQFGQTRVPESATNVVAIAAGPHHNLAVRADSTVVGWGLDSNGQATPPAQLTNVVAVAAVADSSIALLADGSIRRWGFSYPPPTAATNLVAIGGGGRFLAVRADGRVVGWGPGGFAQVEGPLDARVAAGNSSELALAHHRLALRANGTVTNWGANPSGQFTPPAGLSNVTAIAAGYDHHLAVVRQPVLLRQPVDVTAALDSQVAFAVEAVGPVPLSYQWWHEGTNLPSATNATLTFRLVDPAQHGAYTVSVTAGGGSVETRAAVLTVLVEAPFLLREPADRAVMLGGSSTFEITPLGAQPLTFQWRRNGVEIVGATQPTLRLDGIGLGDGGLYSVRVVNSYGSAGSREARLTISAADVVYDNVDATVQGAWQVGAYARQVGTDVLLIGPGFGNAFVRFSGALPRSGRYLVSTHRVYRSTPTQRPTVAPLHRILSDTGWTSVYPPTTPAAEWLDLGAFAFSAGGVAVVDILDVFVPPDALGVADAVRFQYLASPPHFMLEPESTRAVIGGELQLAAAAEGAPPLQYQWFRDGTALTGGTNATLYLPLVTLEHGGGYRVLASNPDGTAYSRTALVQVGGPGLEHELGQGILRLEWSGTARLQEATNVAGPYVDFLPLPESPVELPTTNGTQRFYRLLW